MHYLIQHTSDQQQQNIHYSIQYGNVSLRQTHYSLQYTSGHNCNVFQPFGASRPVNRLQGLIVQYGMIEKRAFISIYCTGTVVVSHWENYDILQNEWYKMHTLHNGQEGR